MVDLKAKYPFNIMESNTVEIVMKLIVMAFQLLVGIYLTYWMLHGYASIYH